MKNKGKLYTIGSPIKVYGKNGTGQIKAAMKKLFLHPKHFKIGWILSIPVPIGHKEFYLMASDAESLKMLPADFCERLQDILNPPKEPVIPADLET
jgi:hypothetical protein